MDAEDGGAMRKGVLLGSAFACDRTEVQEVNMDEAHSTLYQPQKDLRKKRTISTNAQQADLVLARLNFYSFACQ